MTLKDILEMCPNYDTIVNFICEKEDDCSIEFIDYYRDYVHSIPVELNKLKKLDEAMLKYVKDHRFRKEIGNDVVDVNIDVICEFYDEYMEERLKNFGNTQWL